MKVTDIARAVCEKAKHKIIGIRPGEKLHEQMIGVEDVPFTFEYDGHFKILPQIIEPSKGGDRVKAGEPVPLGFSYSSDTNKEWMDVDELRNWIRQNEDNFIIKI